MKKSTVTALKLEAGAGKVIARKGSNEILGATIWTSEPVENFVEVDAPDEQLAISN
ncbi:MAG: hypothetical protein LBB41_00185 [Prevotellaceae bacterium]|jgi:hypothetical protein|nr:hypothetical protein [Prevotellaceae bacterium]